MVDVERRPDWSLVSIGKAPIDGAVQPVPLSTTRRWRRVGQRVAILAVLVIMLGQIAVQTAFAHAELVSTNPLPNQVLPEQPAEIVLLFNEPVSPIDQQFRLFDSRQNVTPVQPAKSGNSIRVALPENLDNGSYVLAWRVISADGHPISGALPFSIGEKSTGTIAVSYVESDPWVDRLLGIAQACAYVCLLAVVGLVFFRLQLEKESSGWKSLEIVLACVALLAMALSIPLTVARQQAQSPGYIFDVRSWIPDVRGGNWTTLELAALGLALVLIASGSSPSLRQNIMLAAGALLALGSLSVVGHTRIVDPPFLIITSNVVHTVAAAIWLGGLAGLALAFRREYSRAESDSAGMASLVALFSAVAAVVAMSVVITGVLSSALILRSVSALFDTDYGRLLMIKVGLVIVVLVLAAWNFFRLVPTVKRRPDELEASRLLRNIVLTELALLIAVASVTGFLVNLSPRVGATSGSEVEHHEAITFEIVLGEVTGTGSLSHITDRTYNMRLTFVDANGAPVIPYEEPAVSVTLESLEIGPLPVEMTSNPDGSLYTGKVDFPFSGSWTISVSVRLSTFESESGVATVEIP